MSLKPAVAASTELTAPDTAQPSPLPARPTPVKPNGPQTLDSRELLGDQAMVLIQHLGEIYRLQTTRQGKLILTK
ncbi:hemin uptake protein HemP [uncultured Limnohabitans sp.]|uniref:hemin uptake protein HemP n=1 Tax=uncultured Limnohabitans sp. TaxID=768543 RepID=UPI0026115A36|nr:hemin uptake protein HemP [uncultured Limnohabitans sp.]